MSKVNLGCGHDYRQGWINLDISERADISCDLSKGIPLKDNTVDELIAIHFLEHIYDTIFIMNEIWRVCKSGAQVLIRVPHQTNPLAFADPTHAKIFNEESFHYFFSDGKHYRLHKEYGIECDFELVSQEVTTGVGGEVKVIFKVKK